jgi:hypothetical protein
MQEVLADRRIAFVYHTHVDEEELIQKQLLQRELKPADFFEEDFSAFSTYESRNSDEEFSFQWLTYGDVSQDLEIPQSLLLGPWDEETTRFLFWLVKGGAQLEWLNSTSGEVCQPALYQSSNILTDVVGRNVRPQECHKRWRYPSDTSAHLGWTSRESRH